MVATRSKTSVAKPVEIAHW